MRKKSYGFWVVVGILFLVQPHPLALAQDVEMKISREIHRGVLYYDTENDSDIRNVDNDNDPSLFRFEGLLKKNPKVRLGGLVELELAANSSANIDQLDESVSADTFKIRKAELYFQTKHYGTLSFGKGNTASENTSEQDISGTFTAAHASVQKVGGGLFFTNSAGANSTVRVNQVFNGFDGLDRQSRIRYDLPVMSGFMLSVSSIDGDQHDLAMRYAKKYNTLQVKAGFSVTDTASNSTLVDSQVSGSLSVLHNTGFNLTIAGGSQNTKDGDANRNPYFIYGKVGYQASLNNLGFTAFAVDFGHYDELRTQREYGETWGLQVLQKIVSWNTDIYISYRNFRVDNVALTLDDINTVLTGVRFQF